MDIILLLLVVGNHSASGMQVHLQMATFGMQDIHAMSGWGSSAAAETPAAGGTAAGLAPAPAVSGLAVLTEKLLGPAKVSDGSLPAAILEVGCLYCKTSDTCMS